MKFEIPDNCINDMVRDSIPETIRMARAAHWTNIEFRIGGKDVGKQADWIKYIKILDD